MTTELLRRFAALPVRYLNYRRFKSAPIWVNFDITPNCPCRCRYCTYWQNDDKDLTTEEINTILRNLKKIGVMYFGISGGEPLIRKDLPGIISYAKTLGLIVGINTSGITRDQKVYRDLMKAGVNTICFSLDGATAETHEKYRPIPPFAKEVQAIRSAVKVRAEGNFPTQISANTIITQANIHELKEISDFCKSLGVDKNNFQPVWNVFDGQEVMDTIGFTKDHRALLEQARDTLRQIPHTNLQKYIELLPEFYTNYEEKIRPMECYAGRAFAYLDAKGTLYPCGILPIPLGSMLRDDPEEILKKKETQVTLKKAAAQKCKGCSLICYQERNIMMHSVNNLRSLWEIATRRFSTIRSFN
jgi:MoaA/NifB/PqqE/SkfB family radical SAM enzyme